MLIDMRNLRQKLWEELCPDLDVFDGCRPWELPFPKERDIKLCFSGRSGEIVTIGQRALRQLSEADKFFFRARKAGVNEDESIVIVLLIRPGVTVLNPLQKRALREIWNILLEWRMALCLSDAKNISFLAFVNDYQDQTLLDMRSTSGSDDNNCVEALRKLQNEKDAISRNRSNLAVKKRKRDDEEKEVFNERKNLEMKQSGLERQLEEKRTEWLKMEERLKQDIQDNLENTDVKYAILKDLGLEAKALAKEEEIRALENSLVAKEKEILSGANESIRKRFRISPSGEGLE